MNGTVWSQRPPRAGDIGEILIGQLGNELSDAVEVMHRNGVVHDPDIA